jgi:hypothetical protein
MKNLQNNVIALFLTFSFFSTSASADHIAIVYCAADNSNNVSVVAADYSLAGGVSTAARRGRSCSQVLHEIMSAGYEILHTDVPHVTVPARDQKMAEDQKVPEPPSGQIVFVLQKPHK